MSINSDKRRPNRLLHETSPYLLQHAHNPVDWYPWGPEALDKARAINRPILLSIGYSSCHWCHVMERESFENEAIAALMNRDFVCIKVDREERPDLDEIYMAATVAMNHGQGGWPMTVFLTPDQEPFFAGTYFPPEDRWGRPGFGTLLRKIAEYWKADARAVRTQAKEMTERLRGEGRIPSSVSISESLLDDAVRQFKEDFDPRYGGFGSAPKFPPAAGLSLLLRCHRRSGDPQVLAMVTKTLDMMAAGGLYDHIGGGFARYSTDERWLVPHFEKMLYDNALLVRTYLETYQATHQPSYRQTVTEVLDYLLREMTDADGGFYSATDADSEGVEGKFFVWTPAEVTAAIRSDEDARRLCAYFDITERGNWEHRSIPNRLRPLEEVLSELGISAADMQDTLNRNRPLLYDARRKRIPPGLDDKVITAWNGMAISAFSEAGRVLNESRYVAAARRAADFLLSVHRTGTGTLYRTSRKGRAQHQGVLEDYAYLAEALIDLYEATGVVRYLSMAQELGDQLLTHFRDREQGGFYTTAIDHEVLLFRAREGADGATPSGNAVASSALARLSHHCGRREFRVAAVEALRAYGRQMARYPRAFAKSLAVVDFLAEGPAELALIVPSAGDKDSVLAQVVRTHFLPNRIIASTEDSGDSGSHPLLAGKQTINGKTTLYLCRDFTCQRPTTDAAEAEAALAALDQATQSRAANPVRLAGRALPGFATAEGTARYAARQVNRPRPSGRFEQGYGMFGQTSLSVSRLGFGCYRVDDSDREFDHALVKALSDGINVIDTSTNYMDGESERLVGTVLRRLIDGQQVARDEVFVISKIGYVQGENLKAAQAREASGRSYPEMVKYGEGIWHCIHPEFLADQLRDSLDRLGLATLDLCLLHNPEYYLSQQVHEKAVSVEQARLEFYRRLRQAFEYLESQVKDGRLRWYGVSSNTVTAPPGAADGTSLANMRAAAVAAATALGVRPDHFAAVQCPMNLFEPGACLIPNNGHNGAETVLSLARKEGLAVLVNRPLNAMPPGGTGVVRLASVPPEVETINVDAQIKKVQSLEEAFRTTLVGAFPSSETGLQPSEYFTWGEELARIRHQVQGLEHWEQIEHQMIAPHVNQVLRAIPRLLSGEAAERWENWREHYVPELLALLRGFRFEAGVRSRERARRIEAAIDPLMPEAARAATLSQKALWTLLSTPGVSCVLNGMRSRAYVDDSTAVLGWKPLGNVESVYRATMETA